MYCKNFIEFCHKYQTDLVGNWPERGKYMVGSSLVKGLGQTKRVTVIYTRSGSLTTRKTNQTGLNPGPEEVEREKWSVAHHNFGK